MIATVVSLLQATGIGILLGGTATGTTTAMTGTATATDTVGTGGAMTGIGIATETAGDENGSIMGCVCEDDKT